MPKAEVTPKSGKLTISEAFQSGDTVDPIGESPPTHSRYDDLHQTEQKESITNCLRVHFDSIFLAESYLTKTQICHLMMRHARTFS